MIAGTVSTVAFAVSNLPMLRKALRTRDVASYSLASGGMINAANVLYSLYVFSLRHLAQANAADDARMHDEVADVLQPIKQGWDEATLRPASR